MYADIIIDITHEKLDKVFQYSIPVQLEERLKVGAEVLVPFGRGNKETKGYVVGFSDICQYDADKIKEITGLSEGAMAIEGKMIALAAWMKEHYGGTMIQALRTVLPVKQKMKSRMKRTLFLLLTEEEGKEKLDFYLHKKGKTSCRTFGLSGTSVRTGNKKAEYHSFGYTGFKGTTCIRCQGRTNLSESGTCPGKKRVQTGLYGRTEPGHQTISGRL